MGVYLTSPQVHVVGWEDGLGGGYRTRGERATVILDGIYIYIIDYSSNSPACTL